MKLKIIELKYELEDEIPSDYGSKLRGYFANRFEEVLFHNHDKNGNFRYAYPLIQYKIINNKPILIGINKGSDLLVENFLDINEINLVGKVYENPDAKLKVKNKEVKVDKKFHRYEFSSPWMALNQKNYKKYLKTDNKEEFLKRKLIGNLLSFAKGIDWWVEKDIQIDKLNLRETKVNYKNRKMIAFKGVFHTNMKLPSNIGLGKSVSKGFGNIIKIND